VFQEAGERRTWAVGLEALDGFVGFEGDEFAAHNLLERDWITWIMVARCGQSASADWPFFASTAASLCMFHGSDNDGAHQKC
jgi:hypothetical protein